MHGLKSTVVLIVVLGGLMGYIYFVDSKKPASETVTSDKPFTVAADQIEEFKLKSESGELSRVQKSGDTEWKLVEPEATEADATAMSTLATQLMSVEIQRVVDENPTDLAQYGLNPPRIDVAFRVKGEKEFRHLLVGGKTPTGGDLYAKKPEETRVFLIASYFDSTLNKTPFDLRDKTVLKFEREKADGLEIARGARGGTTTQFARSGAAWNIAKPAALRADYAALEGLVTRLSSLQMHKIVANEATDLAQYGLDKPAFTVAVLSGSSRATLLIGKQGEDGLYAKDASRPLIFTLEQTITEDLQKDVAEYRRKDMFDSRSFTANRIELQRGAETLAFEKTTAADGKETWKNAAGKDVELAKVVDLLAKFSNMRAQSFEPTANPALKTPALTATVRYDENKTETVTFARAGSDVLGSRAGEPGTAKLEPPLFDETLKVLDTLR